MRYFDLEKIERNIEPLTPTEQHVREQLAYEHEAQLVAKLDLEVALQALTPKQKTCFLLYAQGKTYRGIAAELGLSLPAVQQHIVLAKRKLKKVLSENG